MKQAGETAMGAVAPGHHRFMAHTPGERVWVPREWGYNSGKLTEDFFKGTEPPPEVLPSFVNGNWRKAQISSRKLANLLKEAQARGVSVEWQMNPRKHVVRRQNKGTKHERQRPMREAKVAQGLANQEKLFALHKEELASRKQAKGMDSFLRQVGRGAADSKGPKKKQ